MIFQDNFQRTSIAMILCFTFNFSIAQKPPIDTAAIRAWSRATSGAISADGQFVSYTEGWINASRTVLHVLAVSGIWTREVYGAWGGVFTSDSRYFVFRKGPDSIGILNLSGQNVKYLIDAGIYQVASSSAGPRLIYQRKSETRTITVYSMDEDTAVTITGVSQFVIEPQADEMFLICRCNNIDRIAVFNLRELNNRLLSGIEPDKITEVATTAVGTKMAFILETAITREKKVLYSERPWNSFKILASDSLFASSDLVVGEKGLAFTKDGDRLYFPIKQKTPVHPTNPLPKALELWAYTSPTLDPVGAEPPTTTGGTGVINIKTGHILPITYADQVLCKGTKYAVVMHMGLGTTEYDIHWRKQAHLRFYLMSLESGTSKLIREDISDAQGILALSPDERWIIYFDFAQNCFCSYNITTGRTTSITARTRNNFLDESNTQLEKKIPGGIENTTWLPGTDEFLVCDTYDIWLLDASGRKPPLNLTNGFGREHHIRFRFLSDSIAISAFTEMNGRLVPLAAENLVTKERGFFDVPARPGAIPRLLTMGPYVYGSWAGHGTINELPVRSASGRYLIERMSAEESPNYFISDDLIHYKRISSITSETNFNWLTTDLIHWKHDNLRGDAIVYKPQDFDAHKRYPVIFTYYEERSDELNLFLTPQLIDGPIDIPWFVSRGYIVCVPDIHYTAGHPGQSALTAVESAAKQLKNRTWVDSRHFGLFGHSFGGYETLYICAHSNMFAAVGEANGVSDLTSFIGAGARGSYGFYWSEWGQGRLGVNPWNNPGTYVKNSPIYFANAISAPLLMLHNRGDDVVPFQQAMELYSSLWRLGKKVWLLSYKPGEHVIPQSPGLVDFTIKLTEYFAYYLKGGPKPAWLQEIDSQPHK